MLIASVIKYYSHNSCFSNFVKPVIQRTDLQGSWYELQNRPAQTHGVSLRAIASKHFYATFAGEVFLA